MDKIMFYIDLLDISRNVTAVQSRRFSMCLKCSNEFLFFEDANP